MLCLALCRQAIYYIVLYCGTNARAMELLQLVQFLRLTILYFRMELVVLHGDDQTLPDLEHLVRHQLDAQLPVMLVSVMLRPLANGSSSDGHQRFCADCPTSHLNVVYVRARNLYRVGAVLVPNFNDASRYVLVLADEPHVDRLQVANSFWQYNMVLVECCRTGPSSHHHHHQEPPAPLLVYAWTKILAFRSQSQASISRFVGAHAIFHSNDTNALVFRKEMRRWPSAAPAAATFTTTMMSPYCLILRDVATGRVVLASAQLTLFKMIGDVLNFALKINFMFPSGCPECFAPGPMRNYRGAVPLYDYADVLDGNE